MTDPKIREALRMMGYLLETNGTTGRKARDAAGISVEHDDKKACSWCLVGATDVVFDTLFGDHEMISQRFQIVEDYLKLGNGHMSMVDAWEPPFDRQSARASIVEKLKNA